jgi:uncharacterized protein YbbC (DUF1343 family)
MTIGDDANHYPFHGQTIPAIHFQVTDPVRFDSPAFGIELLAALRRLYPTPFKLDLAKNLLANAATLAALKSGADPRAIVQGWSAGIQSFEQSRKPYLLYQ